MTHIIDLHSPWQRAANQVLMIKKHTLKSMQHLYRVSVVFVAKGEPEEILTSLYAVLGQDLIREVLIVNCSSSTKVAETLYEIALKHSRVFILSGQPSYSLAKAYNTGLRHATSKYLLLVTAPYVLPKEAIMNIMKMSLPKPHPWVMGIELSTRGYFDPFLRLQKNSHFKLDRAGESSERDHTLSIKPDCLLLSLQVISELGTFDTQCSDDNVLLDFCLRVHASGGAVYAHPDLLPLKQLSANQRSQSTIKEIWRSWDYYYQKHFGQLYKKWHSIMLYAKLALKLFLEEKPVA